MGKSKKGRNNTGLVRDSSLLGTRDITINDFANNEKKNSRISKKIMKSAVTARELCVKAEKLKLHDGDDDEAWDAKEDYDFETPESEETLQIEALRKNKKRRKVQVLEDNNPGQDYPFDVWFLISQYIRPQDIGKFACICKTTLHVVSIARFWFLLYKRYHRWVPNLPDDLNHWNIDCARGLRSSVIRCLYYMYSPFIHKISNEPKMFMDLSKLLKCTCILHWYDLGYGTTLKYFYKLQLPESLNRNRRKRFLGSGLPDLISMEDAQVYCNEEEGCYILEVTCTSTCSSEPVLGESLCLAQVGITSNLCGHKVKLGFTDERSLSTYSTCSGKRKVREPKKTILLEPVTEVKFYPWWHPQYTNASRRREWKKD